MRHRPRRLAVAAGGVALAAIGLLAAIALNDPGDARADVAAPRTVTGQLVYSDGKPAGRMPVVLKSRVDGSVRRVLTDEAGKFRLAEAPDGKHRLFEIRIDLSVKTGLCEVLAGRDVTVAGGPVALGQLKLKRKTIPVGG